MFSHACVNNYKMDISVIWGGGVEVARYIAAAGWVAGKHPALFVDLSEGFRTAPLLLLHCVNLCQYKCASVTVRLLISQVLESNIGH